MCPKSNIGRQKAVSALDGVHVEELHTATVFNPAVPRASTELQPQRQ